MNKPPHNPNVRELVQSKRKDHYRQTQADGAHGIRGWHERGYLPHFDAPGLTQFVTLRLADSFPESRRSEWQALFKLETERERRLKIEEYLDRSHGQAFLRQPEIARIVENAFIFFHGQRYDLRAWIIMPNHIHVLVKPLDTPISSILATWKSFTAKEANKHLGRRGQFWQTDYWETYMRNEAHEAKTTRYIENNPAKAKLVLNPKDWPWTSARHRDKYGRLDLRSAAFQAAAHDPRQSA